VYQITCVKKRLKNILYFDEKPVIEFWHLFIVSQRTPGDQTNKKVKRKFQKTIIFL